MPDQDVIPRSVRGPWRQPFRALAGGRAVEDVAHTVTTAVVASIRAEGGMPWAHGLSTGLERSLASGSRLDWELARSEALAQSGGRAGLRLALEQGEVILADPAGRMATDAETALVMGTVERTVQARVLAPARAEMVNRLGDYASEQRYERAVLDQVPVRQIAEGVIRHPDGKGLRAPSRRGKGSTAELLDKPLD